MSTSPLSRLVPSLANAERKELIPELSPELTPVEFQALFDCAPNGIVVVDFQFRFAYANQPAIDLLGVPTLVGQDIFELFPGNLLEPFHSSYRNAMEKRAPSEFEAHFAQPLNRWFKVMTRPFPLGIVIFFQDVSDRRAAEPGSRAQHDLLATVQKAARMATWDLDLTSGIITYGPGSHPVYGHPLDLVATREELCAIMLPAHRDRLSQTMADSACDGMVTVDFQVIAADGSHIWVESRGQRIGASGSRIGGIVTDITARKHNEEALAASEERYRILADLNPQAIWMGLPDGTIIYANQSFLDYTGLTIDSLDGLGWLTGFYPEDRDAVAAAWTRSVQTGDEYNVEARITRARDGQPRLWCLRGLPVRDEAGAILHWLGVAMDIDDVRSSAQALECMQRETERQRAELETIYQTAGIGLSLLSADDFRVLRINDRQADILGLPPEEILGRPMVEVAPIVPDLENIIRTAAAGTPVRDLIVEGELLTKPGERRVFTVSYTPVYATDGSVQAITASSLDITHQKRAEAALVQSEKLAAVGRLTSSISHEINNPLEAITNLLYLIALSEDLPQELKVYVHMAQSELTRVSQIATQTLRFHRQAVKPTLVSPCELVDAVLNLYQGRLVNSGIRVDVRYDTETRVLCFENDIRQVLNNLIANAIDAMRTGGRLIARAHEVHEPVTGRHGIRITIADTGHGMSHEVMARVFEPFYTTKDLNGTGLGLWISHDIVERHQGYLTVKSSEDPVHHGTIFALFLPCQETPSLPALSR